MAPQMIINTSAKLERIGEHAGRRRACMGDTPYQNFEEPLLLALTRLREINPTLALGAWRVYFGFTERASVCGTVRGSFHWCSFSILRSDRGRRHF